MTTAAESCQTLVSIAIGNAGAGTTTVALAMSIIENLEKMLASGQDNALLRYGLGDAYLKEGDCAQAAAHLARAVEHDPTYSAAWKAYGRALGELGRRDEAIAAYAKGIVVAEKRGDVQAAKEMKVFRKRLQKQAGA